MQFFQLFRLRQELQSIRDKVNAILDTLGPVTLTSDQAPHSGGDAKGESELLFRKTGG